MPGVKKTIAVLPGDGIGPEVTQAAIQLLQDCAAAFGHQFEFCEYAFGGNAIDKHGTPLPPETLAGCQASDAVLLGAIGGPKWESLPFGTRPEAGLLGIRKEMGLYINLRPIRVRPALRGISPLRPERLGESDFEIVRELAGDIYFGEHKINKERASDLAEYSVPEIERVARYAFERAAARNKHLTSVDKANVLASSTLWRDTVTAMAREYPGISVDHLNKILNSLNPVLADLGSAYIPIDKGIGSFIPDNPERFFLERVIDCSPLAANSYSDSHFLGCCCKGSIYRNRVRVSSGDRSD